VARAISGYLRTLGSGNSRVDRFIHGQADGLNPEERRGFEIFTGKARCSSCHAGPAFSDSEFHNTGGTVRSGDPGRFAVTGSERDRGAFATPSLRNVSRTAPYMHDGGLPTLDAVIDFYDGGGLSNPGLSPRIRPIQLDSSEKAALIAFLRALEGE
jgi:cytochrome c peroxidase